MIGQSFQSKQSVPFLNRNKTDLLSILVIIIVGLIVYFPSLGIGYWQDDYFIIDLAGRLSVPDYLVQYIDPRVQVFWYRPLIGLRWMLQYALFHGEPTASHAVQIAFHVANCCLLYLLVTRVTHRPRIGLVAALFFAALSLSSMAVYWISVQDPVVGVLWLLTILLWMNYVESASRARLAAAFAMFVAALLAKEVSVLLPIMLFLADRLLVNKPARFIELVKRYAIFVLPLLIFAWFDYIATHHSEYWQQVGYTIGEGTVRVFVRFLALLAFPWELGEPLSLIWPGGAILLFLFFLFRRDRRLLFLGAAAVLPTLVVSPFPEHLFNPRYLYLPLMATAVGYALMLDLALDSLRQPRSKIAQVGLGAIAVWVMVTGGAKIAEETENFAGFIRQIRLQYRPIYQAHSTFAPDTLLYFVHTPLQTLDVSGLMFLRYGANVVVSGTDRDSIGNLRDHHAAFVYYRDEEDIIKEQPVEKTLTAQMTRPLPVDFDNSISLNAIEIASSTLQPGQAVLVLASWKAKQSIAKNYTLFVHLVDEHGQVVAGYDAQPKEGKLPTSYWQPNRTITDAIILPITPEVPPSDHYRLEFGWYYQPTLERSQIVSPAGEMSTDKVVIQTFRVLK